MPKLRARRSKSFTLEFLESRQLLTATYLESIGWSSLKATVGPAMPTGAGIGVAQIEHREQNIGGYQPNLSDPAFAGKAITIESGPSVNSQHATRVGQHLYGTTAGVAPGITSIDSWELDDWSSNFLNVGTAFEPDIAPQILQNHSWDGGSGASDLEVLRRFDYLVERDNIFAAIAIGNQGNLIVPKVLSSSYNGIVVGLTNGTANRGLTSFDGAGRTKPDIVAPEAKSSQATPQVTGAAALLLDQVSQSSWSEQDKLAARESTALKAMLMAGATKSPFANWSRTPQRPLDAVYGSGQLNVYNSFEILTAGQQEPGNIGWQGWDFSRTVAAGSSQIYFLTVPAGTSVGEMSIALTWNRTIRSTLAEGFGGLQSSLANLDMALRRVDGDAFVPIDASVSTVDNVEYLYLKDLMSGTYQIVIGADRADVDYGLAWNALANASTISLTATPGPLVPGQKVTFTATVAAASLASDIPSGTVTFFDGSTPFDTTILRMVGGMNQVVFSTAGLTAGSHTITAKYAGQGGFTSSSASITVNVGIVGTTTTLAASSTSTIYGQPVVLTAGIATSGPGTPTGLVQFWDGTTLLGTSPVATAATGGQATLSVSTLDAGTHSITASYSGDNSFGSSTASAQSVTVAKATTTTTLASDFPSAVFGQLVTLSATVNSPTAIATGTVTFKKGSAVLGTGVLIDGKATFTTSSLPSGTFALTAVFSGSSNVGASTSASLFETVSKASTTTAVTSSATIPAPGQAVTFTAVVAANAPGGGVVSGNVTFKDGNAVLGTSALTNGLATWTTASLTSGTHSIRVVYAGNANYVTSTSPILYQAIGQRSPTTTGLTADVNPALFGQPVTFTAIVPGSGELLTGSVLFKQGSLVLATVPVSDGQAKFTSSSLNVGNSSIVATYSGNSTLAESTSVVLVETVAKTSTLTSVTSSSPSVAVGQPITFTAIVTPLEPGGGIPAGTVTFRDGTTVLGTATLVNGQATFTTSLLTAGTHSIKVVYAGSTNHKTSTSSVLLQTISASLTASITGLQNSK